MKLITLIENTTENDKLLPEHGLSLYMETEGRKILFDTGASGSFVSNAKKMGVNLEQVDLVILSHGHDDHCGGLLGFFAVNDHAPAYLHRKAAEPHYNMDNTFIGIMPGLLNHPRLRFVEDTQKLGAGMTLYTCAGRQKVAPVDTAGLTVLRNGKLESDDFSHEIYLLIEEKGKRVLVSGCSHRGILNIVHWFKPDVLIGGFHFLKQPADGEVVKGAARTLLEYPTVYYTGHCTGLAQYKTMKSIMADRLHYLSTGTTVVL